MTFLSSLLDLTYSPTVSRLPSQSQNVSAMDRFAGPQKLYRLCWSSYLTPSNLIVSGKGVGDNVGVEEGIRVEVGPSGIDVEVGGMGVGGGASAGRGALTIAFP